MATINPRLVELLKTNGEDNTSVWDCHGTWVAYHAAVERMAARANIKFDRPEMIVNDYTNKTVVVCVSASMGNRYEWSFGEVSPANNKNAYPYAMAEKRAKDRVALKLLGMAGLVYSEEEADDFKESKPQEVKSSAALKRDGAWEKVVSKLAEDMLDVNTFGQFEMLKADYRELATQQKWNRTFMEQLKDVFEGYADELQKKIAAENDTVADIQEEFPGARVVSDKRIQSPLEAG